MDRFESGGLYLAHYFYEIRIASIALLFYSAAQAAIKAPRVMDK